MGAVVPRTDRHIWIMICLWLVLSGAALFVMADYGNEPGEAGSAPDIWPAALSGGIVPAPGKPTVVLFAHPLCPCTRATLVELESLTNRLYGLFDLHVLFYEPTDVSGMPEIWAATDLKRMAAKLPGTQLHSDVDGELAKYFGAYTSGQVLLYGTNNRLRFAGGITPSRGHSGENPGRSTLISSIMNDAGVDPLAPVLNPVFGCALHEEKHDDRKLPSVPISYLPQEYQSSLAIQNLASRGISMLLVKRA